MFSAKGKIKTLLPEALIKDQYRSRELLLEVPDGNYKIDIGIEFFGDKVDLVSGYEEGEEVQIFFNVKGRIWNDKVFNNLRAWKIQRIVQKQQEKKEEKVSEFLNTGPEGSDGSDGLPF